MDVFHGLNFVKYKKKKGLVASKADLAEYHHCVTQKSQETLNNLLISCLLCHQFPLFLDQLLSAKLYVAAPRFFSVQVNDESQLKLERLLL